MTRPDYAGLRRWYRIDATRFVGIYDGRESGDDVDGGRWQAICELHGSICSFTTLAAAISFARHPEEWCEDCRQNFDFGSGAAGASAVSPSPADHDDKEAIMASKTSTKAKGKYDLSAAQLKRAIEMTRAGSSIVEIVSTLWKLTPDYKVANPVWNGWYASTKKALYAEFGGPEALRAARRDGRKAAPAAPAPKIEDAVKSFVGQAGEPKAAQLGKAPQAKPDPKPSARRSARKVATPA